MNRIPSFVFRKMAMDAIKPVISVLIIAALLATLPGLISLTVTELTGATPNTYLESPVKRIDKFLAEADPEMPEADYVAQLETLQDGLLDALETFWQEKGVIYAVASLMQMILAPALGIVLTYALLMAVRKKTLTIPGMLQALRWSPKALLLTLWMALRITAWMLPGMIVMTVGLLIGSSIGAFLSSIGSIAAAVLTIRAALHYALAPIALADDSTRSLNACIRASHTVMCNRKMEYFLLQLSFIGWVLLLELIAGMFSGLGALGTALGMLVSLLLNIYRGAAEVCFYEVHTTLQHAAPPQSPQTSEEDAVWKDSEDEEPWKGREL